MTCFGQVETSARGRILSTWTPPPLEQQPNFGKASRSGTLVMKEAMEYVLSLPVSTVIIGCDNVVQLEENVKIAREFTPITETRMTDLTAKTMEVKQQALFFRKWA